MTRPANSSQNKPAWQPADLLAAVLVAGALLWANGRLSTSLSYEWDWGAVGGYLVSRTEDGNIAPGLLVHGMLTTLRLLVWGGVLGMALGMLVALAAISPAPGLPALAAVYVESLRNLPPIVFMFIFYYFISAQLPGGDAAGEWLAANDGMLVRVVVGDPALAGNFIGGALCLAVFESAFFAEVFRAGLASVERGQRDGAKSLGLSRWHAFRLVVLPQALQKTAAPLVGQLVILIKDSAILSVISVEELTFAAQEAAVSSQQVFEVWLAATLFYFMLCWPMLKAARALERRAR